jgi:D-alanyl-D-alanine carboxypeptidase/D-alanyl-D-alanine-endopeptidase (penicillin-binding protein 4)
VPEKAVPEGRPAPHRTIAPLAAPGAEQWLRRGMAAVGVAIVIAAAAGSVLSSGDRPADQPDAAPSLPPAASLPVDPEPTAPAPVLGDDLGAAPAPTASGVAKALAARLADPRLGGRVSAQVMDVGSGAVLYDNSGSRPAVPASTAKLMTAAALLAVARPDDRFTTRVVAGTKPGEVVLVGGGDPTLSAAAPGKPTSFPGAARLSDLAALARQASPNKITKVLVDTSRYAGPRIGTGWDPGDVSAGYVAPITALMADVGRTDPASTAEPANRSTTPELAAAAVFAARLGLPADAVAAGAARPRAPVLATVRSAPVGRLIEQMLLASDNVLAETLARQVAVAEKLPASFTGAAAAVRRVLTRLGVPTTGMAMLDGSGLSPEDRVAPATLVGLLRVVASVDHPTLHTLVPGLPVGGYDGTLDRRYTSGPSAVAAGSVRAKTGTLNGVDSLAGVVADRDGRLLVFAFLADRVDSALPAEDALDEAAAALAGCGCR